MALDVPSGQPIALEEVLVDQVGDEAWVRFRFLAPDIAPDGGAVTYAEAEADFQALCDGAALPYLAQHSLAADVIAISMMDRFVAFGVADPTATQFFELFRIEGETCVWQAF